ncbi:MAG: lytic transglycosylase domain-containing protein [Magnetococcales bacterium]|nr:lytic transglycosylase domain-containing protein [Magnetococcales bacterium]
MSSSRLWSRLFSVLFLALLTLGVFLLPGRVSRAEDDTFGLDGYRRLFTVLDADIPITTDVLDRSRWPTNDLLASYLELELLSHPRMMRPLTSDLRRFVQRWPDHPHAGKVVNMLSERVADEGTQSEVLAWFDKHPPHVGSQQKRYLEALLTEHRVEEAWRLYHDYYRIGHDALDIQDRLLVELDRRLTADDHETRARALIEKGKGKDLPAVLRALSDPNLRDYFNTLAAARGGSKSFELMLAKLPLHLAQSSELWFERAEYFRRHGDLLQAISLLQGPQGKYLNAEDGQRARYRLAKDLVHPKKEFANAWLILQPSLKLREGKLSDTLWLAGWCAYKLGNKSAALEVFKRLGEEGEDPRLRSQGAIWAAVILGVDTPEAAKWLELASRNPESFYGFMGAEMSRPHTLTITDQTKPTCAPLLQRPDLQGGISRMTVLKEVGRSFHNGLEAQALAEKHGLTVNEQVCLAITFGDPNHAIRIATPLYAKQGVRIWEGLFPVPSWKPDTGWLLDPALVWGTGRQESLFSPTVVSRSGALGLLQLMPTTAKEEANLLKLDVPSPLKLRRPGYNLSLGQSYLYRMLKRFDGDLVMALISYNAGPARADNWRHDRQIKDSLTFIEEIPIQETRDYVKKVTHGLAMYRQLIYGNGSVLGLISPGRPGMRNLAPPSLLGSTNIPGTLGTASTATSPELVGGISPAASETISGASAGTAKAF